MEKRKYVVLALNYNGSSYMWNEVQYPKVLKLQKVFGPICIAAVGLLLTSEGRTNSRKKTNRIANSFAVFTKSTVPVQERNLVDFL